MTNLMINIDHVATLRNARREQVPDPVHAAVLCEMAGADGIVFHLREDRRHINEQDVKRLKDTVKGRLDFELSVAEEIVGICCDIRPHLATLVPEKREEVTTEGGLNLSTSRISVEKATANLKNHGIAVSYFLDPVAEDIRMAGEMGADCVELHTGEFANAKEEAARDTELKRLADAAKLASSLGLRVHAGHGLDYSNYPHFRAALPEIAEVSIGFAVVARAVLVGMERAVREMRLLVKGY